MHTIDVDTLVAASTAIFEAAGLSRPSARTVSETLVEADSRGIPSHGLMLVPMYVDRLRAGSVSRAEAGEVVVDTGAIATLDAHHALGQLTGDQAMSMAVDKAHEFGVGLVSVRRAFHFGGAFRYARHAANDGCVGLAAANTRPLMPATGGATRVVGNNPLAIGVPRGSAEPMVLDMAMSEAALGKIRLAEREGREIPANWASDASGVPTTDPSAAIAGMLLPLAGPKGYGLALMVDVLTGVLSGGAYGNRVQGLYADTAVPNDCAHVFLAIDVAAFGDEEDFTARITDLAEQIGSSELSPGTERVLLPGQREAENAASARDKGVSVDPSVLESLRATAKLVEAELPEPL